MKFIEESVFFPHIIGIFSLYQSFDIPYKMALPTKKLGFKSRNHNQIKGDGVLEV